ncbi:MAG: DNA primase [Clostridia bacterium]|nr:DNA primase [Clostridia bacterium]
MAERYPPAWLEELRTRSDLVQVVSGYVALKKKGKRYWGLCPFHGEKTASFSVDEEAQLYYCFGCKAGGSVFTFVSEMEHLSFSEAVEYLADRAHMALPQMMNDEEYERRRSRRERLLGINREAARFFHDTLFTPAGAAALAYLRGRGLNDSVIRKFGLGAAPDSWDALTRHLTEKGYTLDELSSLFLTRVREAEPATENTPARPRRVYDIFRNRVMFPIIDQYGNVIAFSGRILEKGGEQKYVNTSDTPVFNKGKNIFGANLLKKERRLERVILVEGNLDVVSLTQFGIRGVCATLGTALTEEQARLIRRFAPEVCLAYDGDAAGQKAILKGLEIFRQEGIPCRVLDFPAGMDPDDFIRREGPEGFAALKALTPEAYRIRLLKAGADLSTREGKVQYARKTVEIIAGLDPVERDGYIWDLSLQTGFGRDVILAQLEQETKKRKDAAENPWAARDAARGGGRTKQEDPLEAMGLEKPGQRPSREKAREPRLTDAEWKMRKAEELLIGLLATGLLPKDLAQEDDFTDPELKEIYRALGQGIPAAALIEQSTDGETRSRLTRLLMPPAAESTDELIAMAQDCAAGIREGRYEMKLKEIEERMANCTDDAELARLMAEYQALDGMRRKTKGQ